MRTLYFDCFSGAGGDMIVGALLDAGADAATLRSALGSLPVEGYQIHIEKVVKKGIAATQFSVRIDPGVRQPHRHVHHVLDIIEKGDLPASVKKAAAETFRRIAVAEAEVHGTSIEKVHFHEVGAIDSIIDVVGAHLALHLLGVEAVYASPLQVGSGTISGEHGVMLVPAPATALLLKGIPWYAGDVKTELVTPTGAAILSQIVQEFGPMRPARVDSIGYGSGTRDLADRANVLRVFLGETVKTWPRSEEICVIETNVDDMTPELLAPLIGDLIDRGARDAFVTPVLGKKGRLAHLVTVLCDASELGDMLEQVFRGSSTFGVRIRTEERVCLDREWKIAETPWGEVRVKLGSLAGSGIQRAAPEFDDCRRVATENNVSVVDVYQAALAAAIKGELHDVRRQ